MCRAGRFGRRERRLFQQVVKLVIEDIAAPEPGERRELNAIAIATGVA
jgi:hypothetical protein